MLLLVVTWLLLQNSAVVLTLLILGGGGATLLRLGGLLMSAHLLICRELLMWRSTFAVEWATDVAIILVLLGGLHMWCCYGGHPETVGCATDVLIVLLLLYRATNVVVTLFAVE